ncbi:hypothetical protein SUGI_0669980 [Cryptomeria japonica]|nr:hypothetical protein SUGI_0669980 [Cryptomeria japonica]
MESTSASSSSCNAGYNQPEIEHTNASQAIAPSPSTSAVPTVGTLFSSCFNWCSFFLSLCSRQSNSIESPSSSQTENEVTNAFQGLAPSPCAASSSKMRRQYDVFINHRGPDVKYALATTLYRMLSGMGLGVFLDSEELELGDSLPREIEEAMRNASLHIAIFSQNYIQSPWCLAELSFMIKTGSKIVPIFYHVQPDDVRYAKGVYADAFSQHEKKGRYASDKLQEWKKALNNVSYNIGHIVNDKADEDRLLKNIVYCVLKEIKKVPYVVAERPVGLDEVVKDFELTMLESDKSHQNVQIVGIWGMGGSGKTTLAKKLYNNIYPSMDKSSLVLNIRGAASKSLLHDKQKKLLSDLGFRDVPIDNIEDGKAILASKLRSVRALVVLDDVDHVDQLDALIPDKDGLGSRSFIASGTLIVVTTREFEVLRSWGISSIYKMKPLQPFHAKQLFCWHAFLQPFPAHGFEELVENFLKACNGLPLSLKVLGAQLYGDSNKDRWKTQLDKILRILPKDISQRLKVSYDALDDEEKEIFLDAACFFIGEKKTLAIAVWDGSGWNGLYSLERLVNKCLLEINDNDCIIMHDHLRDLGREIANQQSPYRLWFSGQLIKVHSERQRIGIRGIMATTTEYTSEFERFHPSPNGTKLIANTSEGYRSLTPSKLGIKILQVRGNSYHQIIGNISRELVWLRWYDFGQNNLGSLGSLKNLRVLELFRGKNTENFLEELWETDSDAPVQLRELVISECYNFQRFPTSIGGLKSLRKLVLSNSYGNKIRSLPDEFCLLHSLEHLELSGCGELSSLWSSFGHLRNLRHLDLSDCKILRRLPISFKELTLLQHLNLQGCSKLTLEPNILENMIKLEYLDLSKCEQLEELPRHIRNQASLRKLYLGGMCRLMDIPLNITELRKLQVMIIGSELLTSLPRSLGDLSSLTALMIRECPKLEVLPDSLGYLNLLEYLEISNSGVKSLPQSVRQLNNLQRLHINGCPISQLDLHLEELRAETRWEEAGIQSLNGMERLRIMHLTAISR